MNIPEDVINHSPDENWVERLRRNNKIWLVKENEYAVVEWEWEPPEPGHRSGRIGIHRAGQTFSLQNWFVSADGCGIDGSRLFLPVEGHLLDDPEPLSEPEIRQIRRELDRLRKKVEYLYLFGVRNESYI